MAENKAFTMADARALPVAKSASRLELMALAKRNISDLPADEQLPALMALVDEVHDEVTQIKEAVEDVWFLQPAIEDNEESPPMEFLQTFIEQVEQTLNAEGQSEDEKAVVLQAALNDVTMSINKARIKNPQPISDIAIALKAAISDGMAPLIDQMAQINARLGAVQQPIVTFPVQKSVTGPALNTQQPAATDPISPITGQPSSLTQMVRRSVGLY